jgi:hypothetical protein
MKNNELDLAFEFIQYTNKNIFLTGKAGTGKTTFLRSLKGRTHKRMVVLAPTGVAAINAGGQTIHSFFQLPFGPILTERAAGHKVDNPKFKQKFNKRKINIIKSLDLVVIDEISMVRADVLDAIDDVLRRYRDRFRPFGGLQLLMIGDLQQLAPVVKDDEWAMLRNYYASMYFFNSKALRETGMVSVELKHVYRQAEGVFLDILNEVRDNRLSQASYDLLLERYKPDFRPKDDEGYITLTTHNNAADRINEKHLAGLKSKSRFFEAKVSGEFSEYSYPTDFELELKVGAQVMFVKNDSSPEKRYFNGKIGVIKKFTDDEIVVECEGEDDIYAGMETWENVKYSLDEQTKEIKEQVVGSFTQYPLRLAWAITIHKSQGLTFDKAIIDAAAAFAHGQTYVALSRCRTLEGLVLSTKISPSAIICDREVGEFNRKVSENQPDEEQLRLARQRYQFELLQELFSFGRLAYWFERLEKVLWEQGKAALGNLKEVVMAINKERIPELNKVSKGFIAQMQQILLDNPDVEQNEFLQERIRKGSEYFHKYLDEHLLKPLAAATFESDNKETRKAVEDALDQIGELLRVKQKSLEVCKKGFRIEQYLEVRAKAAIAEEGRKKKVKIVTKEADSKHPELYQMLKFWRKEEADMRLVALYQVASNKMIQGIADNLPTSTKELLKINGVGKKKVEQYGEVLIDMVKEYMVENNIPLPEPELEIAEDKPKKKKRPAGGKRTESFQLFQAGKDIPEIAAALGLAESTVEGHLAYYVGTGELDVDEFVPEDKVADIMAFYDEHPDATMGEVRAALGDDFDWRDIKFVHKHRQFLAQEKTAE